VKRIACLLLVLVLLPAAPARAGGWCRKGDLDRANHRLHGQLVDYTHNHGADRRIWSEALGQRRDLYVYLPPGFDPARCYPLMIWLHGFAQDEQSFLLYVVQPLDDAMASGKLPPMIVASPDGSLNGDPCLITAGSFFLDSDAGRFEQYLMHDVWDFLFANYPIRPEREAHVLAGVSMGGGSAYNLGIKYRDRFKVIVGIFPPLNTRWVDCHCKYMSHFDPDCWGWRTDFSRRHEVIGRFYGVVVIPLNRVVEPLYGRGPDVLPRSSAENPIEMLDRYDLHEGELSMYIGYGGKDQFNITAQVDSFLYRAKERGLGICVAYDPDGKHDLASAKKLLPGLLDWLRPQIQPFAP
jgi:S-formylglutathione hydrolase FrmB